MSQNGPYPGPPWPGGNSDNEPYAEPADPWGDHAVAEPSWSTSPPPAPQQLPIPHQSAAFHTPPPTDPPANSGSASMWGSPAAPRRNTPIVALVVVLGLLIVAGLGATAWLLKRQRDNKAQPTATASVAATVSGAGEGSEDARFVTQGQCVANQGTTDQPDMRKSVCTTGTYLVLRVIKGKTTGEKDAESKCAKVPGYTNWFFYDSDLDDLDIVLCLKKQ
jgi:hypothetical protein